MSASAAPIPLDRFAQAITELPLGNLHAKAAELRNSIAHLSSSNEQLQEYANDGDQDCADAIRENNEVIDRMEIRIKLLRDEVENRGFRWGEDEPAIENGKADDHADHSLGDREEIPSNSEASGSAPPARTQGGSLRDEELARRLRDQMDEDMHDNGDGIHL
ncbi:MAG: hypothetical protein Q9225_006611 [Loekoesia sp. 1 TL-2023]